MTIKVKFFASLGDWAGGDKDINAAHINTVDDVWKACFPEAERPSNVLMAINQEYADATGTVKDGDEVAFFPPVTGG